MKIFIPNISSQKIGGGWSFIDYFSKYVKLSNYEDSDIYFIAGATMVDHKSVLKAKEDGKRVVLRVDNMPKNSRNRGTSSNRLYDFASLADLIIYQSKWAKEYVGYFVAKDGPIVYNGVDTSIFTPNGPKWPPKASKTYLYSRYSRDECKRPDEAFYYYHMAWRKERNSELWIIGKFGETACYNFDFFMNEPVKYMGIIEDKAQVAMFMRGASVLLYPYFNDACSNTLIEALCCGLEVNTCLSGMTGGSKEIFELHKKGFNWSAERMVNDYINEFKKL